MCYYGATTPSPTSEATTATLVERVFDGVVMLTFIVIPIAIVPTLPAEMRWVAQLTAPIFLLFLGAFFICAARPMWLRGVVAWGCVRFHRDCRRVCWQSARGSSRV
ncbi:MAG UNVERIFIED_CONTAM: hypothetical protein LVT10_26580 [Anaerolineae bacterium]